MRQFVEESFKSGVSLSTVSFMPRANGANMRLINGKFDVEDAPISQEQVAGFAILKTETDAELQNLVKRFLKLAGGGECQILRLNEFPQE